MKKVLLFGVFDGVHDGHRALFRQARAQGDYLIVAAAQDGIVEQLKGSRPRHTLAERIGFLNEEALVDLAVGGDATLGDYAVIGEHHPHAVVLGYDQRALGDDLRAVAVKRGWEFEVIVADPYLPERYHNSILHRTV